MNSARGIAGRSLTYNAEDQLVAAGTTSYQYDADSFLARKIAGTSTTNCTYSTRGELLTAALPTGTTISYVYDSQGRRIAKKVNGTVVEKYLWSGLTRLLAVYDGANNLLERFEYADAEKLTGDTY